MQLVEQHIINNNHKYFNECNKLSSLSKNLYNSALYFVRQHFFKNNQYINYYGVNRNFIDNNQIDYIELPRKVSNQTLMLVDKSFKSFFSLLKKKNIGKYNKKIKIPQYLPKDGKMVVIYEKGAISRRKLKNGKIKLSGTDIIVTTKKENINQVRIVPKLGYFIIEIIYTIKSNKNIIENNKIASIDLGVNNLMSVTSNVFDPFIINGKPVKSINQYYNKLKAKYQTKKITNKIKKLGLKRRNKIHDYLHKSSRQLVNHLVSNNITKLIIGYNKEWKQDINIGKVNNQKFVSIPYSNLIYMLTYKCEIEGISVIINEESYTSKCSFLDMEDICKHVKYLGKRIKRGLFKASDGRLINSDINGSYNILRKVVPNVFSDGIEGLAVNPIVYTIKG